MKKKFLSFALVCAILAITALPSFATSQFDMSVFDNSEDITVEYDDMSGRYDIYTTSLITGKGKIRLKGDYDHVTIYPHIGISDDMDVYVLCLDYYARDWAFIDEITIKIGNNLYTFTDFTSTRKIYSDATIKEHLAFSITPESISFMQDLIEHRNEKIKVRLHGSANSVDFFLSSTIKDGIINTYNLYVMGGGTAPNNMNLLTLIEETQMTTKCTQGG